MEEEYRRLDDINKDFQRKMSVLNPRDVSAARNLILQHEFDVEDQQGKIGEAEARSADIKAAATAPTTAAAVAAVRGVGQAPYQVPVPSAPSSSQVSPVPATTLPVSAPLGPSGNMNLPNITYGDLIVNIDGKQLMKVGGIMAARPGSERLNLTQRGIS